MPQQWPATDIARMILDGFDDYREHFRRITDGARERFEQARWQEIQTASAARINLYEEKVGETITRLREYFDDETLMNVSCWPLVKSAYISVIDLRFDDELSETWYNSIFCGLFSHDLISDGCMFIHHASEPASCPGCANAHIQAAGAVIGDACEYFRRLSLQRGLRRPARRRASPRSATA